MSSSSSTPHPISRSSRSSSSIDGRRCRRHRRRRRHNSSSGIGFNIQLLIAVIVTIMISLLSSSSSILLLPLTLSLLSSVTTTTTTTTEAKSINPIVSSLSFVKTVRERERGHLGRGRGRGVGGVVVDTVTSPVKEKSVNVNDDDGDGDGDDDDSLQNEQNNNQNNDQNNQNNENENVGASIITSIFNLSNNVAGAGILTLAAGKATSGTGYIPSIIICIILASLSSYTFSLIGKSCEVTGLNEFKDLWLYAFNNCNNCNNCNGGGGGLGDSGTSGTSGTSTTSSTSGTSTSTTSNEINLENIENDNSNNSNSKDNSNTTTNKYRVVAVDTSWIVDTMIFIQCFFVSIIYTGLLGDVFSALLQGSSSLSSSSIGNINININNININKWYTSRTSIILILSTFVLLPLNLIKDLNSLGFTSILGLLSVLYTVGFMFIRAFDGSYSVGSGSGSGGGIGSSGGSGIGIGSSGGGKVASTASAIVGKFIMDGSLTANQIPTFTKSTLWNIDINSLVLTSNLGLAFIAHYNAPSYWKSLKGNNNATSKTFTTISNYSYIILSIIYVVTMICGYVTFGDISMGNILLNYSSNDILALFGRIATGLSIIFGFPLISNGCREGFKNMCISLNIMNGSDNSNNGSGSSSIDITNPNNHTTLVLCLLITTTFLSIIAKDIGLIAGLTGALMGSSLVYICPPLIYYKIIQRKYNDGSGSVISSIEYKNAKKNLLFIPFGIFTATMGIIMTLKNAFF